MTQCNEMHVVVFLSLFSSRKYLNASTTSQDPSKGNSMSGKIQEQRMLIRGSGRQSTTEFSYNVVVAERSYQILTVL